MITQTCYKCTETKGLDEFYSDKSKPLGVHGTCKECMKRDRKERYAADPEKYKARMREYQQGVYARAKKRLRYEELVDAALNAYGDKCSCCEESGRQFLTVDHVGGWGAEHRSTGQSVGNIYYWLKKHDYPQDGRFRVLCWNCNCALGTRGYCHEGTMR